LDVKTALNLTRKNIGDMSLEQLQRHKVRLVSAFYEAHVEYGFEQAVRDGYYLPIASESATGYMPRHLWLQNSLKFHLDQTAAREKELLADETIEPNKLKGALPMEKSIESERQDKLQHMSSIYSLSKYGEDDYSYWVFTYSNESPIPLDLSRTVQGSLSEVFNQIDKDDEWILLRRTDDYAAYPVQNKEVLAEKYADAGYSERGTLEQIYGAVKEDMERYAEAATENEEAAEDEEDYEI